MTKIESTPEPNRPQHWRAATDLAIEHLALREAELVDEARDLAADAAAYRLLAAIAIAEVARLTQHLSRANQLIGRMREELRHQRGTLGRAA